MSAPRLQTPALSPILLVGRGRVSGALRRAALAAALEVRAAGRADGAELARGCEVALLCVPDAEISAASAALADAAPELRFVGHASGASTLAAVEPSRGSGASTFSLHPLQTIPDGETDLVGCPAAIAGSDQAALGLARELAERLGMRPFEVPEESRAGYHAAASIASNLLVTLESSAVELLDAAGVANPDEARELLTPLVLRTASNWAERGPAALTGPVARGDEATLDRHREAIAERAPELAPLYEALVERTREIAASKHEARA